MLRALAAVTVACVVVGGSGVVPARTEAAGALEPLLAPLNFTPLTGQTPPRLVLPRLADGKTVTLAELRGRPVIVYFWATW